MDEKFLTSTKLFTLALHLRMKAHGTNALAVAKALERSPHVEGVIYPGLASHQKNDLAYASLSPHARKFVDSQGVDDGFPYGGMISFRIKGGEAQAEKFLTSTKLFTLAESLGGVESLAEHPGADDAWEYTRGGESVAWDWGESR